jgi:hypothetical protein
VRINGAKNCVLPILAATLINAGQNILHNCPDLKDVDSAIKILEHLGCKVKREGKTIIVDSSKIDCYDVPDELMREMRSSVIFLGPIIARCGKARLTFPGGCELGPRPIDLHLEALSKLGIKIVEKSGEILCEAEVPFKQGLHDYIKLQRALIGESSIDLRLNTQVTLEYAQKESPDVIIAAVGSDPITPSIRGINKSNVYQAIDVYRNPSLIKGRVVILGAGFVGTELAIYLKQFGIDSEIVEMLGDISDGGNSTHKNAILDMITQKNIPIHFNTKAVEITGDGVKCQSPDGEVFYDADAVIHAVGMRPLHDEALKFSLYAKDFHMIGECRKAANILYATSTAYAASRLIGRF